MPGIILAGIDATIASLQANHGWAAFCGESLGSPLRIYRDVLPPPASDQYTLAEMAAYRPLVQLWIDETQGWMARKNTSSCFTPTGRILMRFERAAAASVTESVASREFLDALSEVFYNDNGTGLMQDSQRINMNEIKLAGWTRTTALDAAQYGDAYMAEVELSWGLR